MLRYSQEFAKAWCQEQGWTDFFIEQYRYWAFPPGAVMPLPLPNQALQLVPVQKVLSRQEKLVYGASIACILIVAMTAYWLKSPMPLTFGFVFCAIAIVLVEEDDDQEIAG
ncbi:MAG: hypothetical protein KME35_09750 [Aphanocapsa sp. GSE-SYN-MK-11-07L]|jgi:hypothetical protein|nr:hypothetical protein [Aphanocapsa sp. GSE-SYN-MK-11-07L]